MSELALQMSCKRNSPVHVLFMIDQLCEAGGAERMLISTIRLLPKDRFRCSLITFKIDRTLELFANLPCPHYVLPLRRTYDLNAVQVACNIRRFIRKEVVEIVHTFHETSDLWGGLICRMKRGPALISSRRDMGILRSPKHHFAYRIMNSRFDLVITVSEEVRRFCMEKDRLPGDRVWTVYNGLELKSTRSETQPGKVRSSLGLDTETPLIVTVGHIRRVKGIDVLVETAAKVWREFPRAVFLVVGGVSEPEYLREIETQIRCIGITSNLRFLGKSEDVFSLLKTGDVFFLPSRSEGFSNALIEAMACGLPCVATRVGGNPEAVEEGRSGYIVESGNAEQAADRILKLLRNPLAARQMGAIGKTIVETKFTADVMIQQLVRHYERLLAEKRN